ncbi:MAG: VOC family protein [Oscillospiraceae bacterium]|nr:VOC family protein [Oscillospiraceae bacterium]
MSIKISLTHIFIDCKDPAGLQEFYHKLTGLEKCKMYNSPGLVINKDLMLMFSACDFDYIPPVWPEEDGMQQKQIHLDFGVEDLDASVAYAVELGAVKAPQQYGVNHWVTLFDPEGHPFCLGIDD